MVTARGGTAGANGFGRDVDERPGAARSQHDWQVHSVARAAAERAVLHDAGEQLVRKLHLSAGTVGLDGTVIAAAASHYRMLRAEALREAALSEQAERILVERQAARELAGRAGAATLLAPQEPEAVVQPTQAWAVTPKLQTVGAAPRKWAGDRAGGACEQRDRGGDGLVATAPDGVRG